MRIVHELSHRLRARNAALYDPGFDSAYFEAVLQSVPGVDRVRINPKAATVVVEYNGERRCREAVLRYLRDIPDGVYRPDSVCPPGPDPVGAGVKGWLALLSPAIPRPLRGLLSWVLAMPVLLRGGETLFSRGAKVEVLDALALGFSLFRRDYLTANAIVSLLSVGEYLEQISEDRSTGLLKTLLRPQVETVWAERQGKEIALDVHDLVIGDIVVCGSGEMIPVDGEVAGGEALVNQSSVTGESVPVHMEPGSEVFSGSLIAEGRLRIRALQVGEETSMARIQRFLENSLRFRSPSQRRSEALADRLVPATLGLGLGILLLTRDFRRAAAVFTVDYSCAIKLATPVAVKTAMFTAAHDGVLLKGAQALETFARVDTLVFDKTGTLTQGKLEVTDLIAVGEMTEEALLALAAGAEAHYAHPVASAVVSEATQRGLEPTAVGEVDFIVAHGVSAYLDGKRVLVGSHHFIAEDEGIDCSPAEAHEQTLRAQGKSLLYVARDDRLEGVIALRDALRPEAAPVLDELKSLGIENIVVLTGDHPDTARAVADQLPALDAIYWDLKPEDKAEIVRSLKEKRRTIAFAGDGVNDAPALMTADLGISLPGGADLARESAQVLLLQDDLRTLLTARRIAQRAEHTIENCFKTAVGANSLFLLLASGGLIPPVMAAILHNASTVGVLGYAALSGMETPKGRKKEEA